MKNQILVIIVLIFVACHKQDETIELQLPDNIIYTDLIPDVEVSSIDTVYYMGYDDNGGVFKCDSLKSTGRYAIDLNEDGVIDLSFEHKFWKQEPFYNSPHFWGSYYENIKIGVNGMNGTKVSGMNEEDLEEFSNFTFPLNPIENISNGTSISDTSFWAESGIIFINSQGWLCFYESESQYIGVKIEKGDDVLYGWVEVKIVKKELNLPLEDNDGMAVRTDGSDWIKDLIIKGWAINKTSNNSILAGQME